MRGSPLEGQNPDVSPPEGGVTQSIAEGVDGRVDVAETVSDVPHHLRDDFVALSGSEDALHHCQHVVWSPGEYEDQQNGGERLGRLPLLPLLLRGLLEFVLPGQGAGGGGAHLAHALHVPAHTDNQTGPEQFNDINIIFQK